MDLFANLSSGREENDELMLKMNEYMNLCTIALANAEFYANQVFDNAQKKFMQESSVENADELSCCKFESKSIYRDG